VRVVDDQRRYVGLIPVAQLVHLFHVSVALVGETEHVLEVRAGLRVIRLVGVHEAQADVVDAAVAE
jgi:hypothetical protein